MLGSWTGVIDYLRMKMAHSDIEQYASCSSTPRTASLPTRSSSAARSITPPYPREIIKRALEHGATALILVHGPSPSASPTGARADIEMTRQVRDAAEKLGVALHDHVIVARHNKHASFRTMGLL